MKNFTQKFIGLLALVFTMSFTTNAQCDETLVLTSQGGNNNGSYGSYAWFANDLTLWVSYGDIIYGDNGNSYTVSSLGTESGGLVTRIAFTSSVEDVFTNGFTYTSNIESCVIEGCTEPSAQYYMPYANTDDGSCIIYGCMDDGASNFNSIATNEDNSCLYPGCTYPNYLEYDETANTDDGSCSCVSSVEISIDITSEEPFEATVSVVGDYSSNSNITGEDLLINGYLFECITAFHPYFCVNAADELNYTSGSNITVEDLLDNGYLLECLMGGDPFSCELAADELNYSNNSNFEWSNDEGVLSTSEEFITSNPGEYNLILIQFGCDGIQQGFSVGVGLAVSGCTNSIALNYNEEATEDDGSCIALGDVVQGCLDATALNYNSTVNANTDDGSCIFIVEGCTDNGEFFTDMYNNVTSEAGSDGSDDDYQFDINGDGLPAFNYDSTVSANTDNGSCIAVVNGCIDATAFNYDSTVSANTDDGSCIAVVNGCMDDAYIEFNAFANTDDNSCTLSVFIDLPEGWSMFGYTCLGSVDAMVGFLSISDKIEIVKDEWGLTYLPEWDFNAIGSLQFSEGYQIKMIEEVIDFQFCSTITPEDVDASYADGVASVTPEDGITQADLDALSESYAGWCASDIDNDGICDDDEVSGCMDVSSCNYVSAAEFDNDSCDYVSCLDDCGVINGDNSTCLDCAGVVYGTSEDLGCGCGSPATQAGFYCDGTAHPQIGDIYAGGIVFQINEDGTGLVSALEDLTEGATDPYGWGFNGYEWGCFGQSVNGADGTSIGTGYQNTMDIVNQGCSTENGGITAAQAALDAEINGYIDWYLPSQDETAEMYNTIGNGGPEDNIGGFEYSYPYWSSSSIWSDLAINVVFDNGITYGDFNYKNNTYRVRIIRSYGYNWIEGCLDSVACNYSPEIIDINLSNCEYPETDYNCDGNLLEACTYNIYIEYSADAQSYNANLCQTLIVYGCTDYIAENYNYQANTEDNSCQYILGCVDISADNYDSDATKDDSSCIYLGCLDTLADNFNTQTNQEDGSCIYYGCMNSTADNYDSQANQYDVSCLIYGCTLTPFPNYNDQATMDDGSCDMSSTDLFGCTNPNYLEYEPTANQNNGTCSILVVYGCTGSDHCNYNPEANTDDGSCVYTEQGYDCDGNFNPQVGDEVLGGIVFYIDETGQHGLVASLEDLGQYAWGCTGTTISGADGTAIGTGYQNTLDIVADCSETNTSALNALNATTQGYTDWYLPSSYELQEMYNTIGNGGSQGNIGGFSIAWYWSSSEDWSIQAWFVSFNDGNLYSDHKSSANRVRVIRSFYL